jgi:hypothetical protein
LLKSSGIAPAVAGALALLAAGLLISFSMWAQKLVLEDTADHSVQAERSSQGSSSPLVVQDLDSLAERGQANGSQASSGTQSSPSQVSVGLVATISPINVTPPAIEPGNETPSTGTTKETRSGHIGGKYPHSEPAHSARESSADCGPRSKNPNNVPPGHCKHGETDGEHSPGHGSVAARKGSATPVAARVVDGAEKSSGKTTHEKGLGNNDQADHQPPGRSKKIKVESSGKSHWNAGFGWGRAIKAQVQHGRGKALGHSK